MKILFIIHVESNSGGRTWEECLLIEGHPLVYSPYFLRGRHYQRSSRGGGAAGPI